MEGTASSLNSSTGWGGPTVPACACGRAGHAGRRHGRLARGARAMAPQSPGQEGGGRATLAAREAEWLAALCMETKERVATGRCRPAGGASSAGSQAAAACEAAHRLVGHGDEGGGAGLSEAVALHHAAAHGDLEEVLHVARQRGATWRGWGWGVGGGQGGRAG